MENKYDSLLELCRSRKSCRSFTGAQVPRDMVDKILAVAGNSPYAAGRRDWDIMAINDPRLIAEMAAAVRLRVQEISGTVREDYCEWFKEYARYFTVFESAPLILVPVFRHVPALSLMMDPSDPELTGMERDNYVKSISCVAMLVLLAAEALGLGACYLTGPLIAEEELARMLALKPGRNIGALIPIGYPLNNDNYNGTEK